MAVLFENHKQATKVRWITWGSVICAVGWLYWAWTMAETYGLSPGDGGVLRPAAQRYAVACGMVLAALAPLAGMIVYSRLYLVRIERERDDVTLTSIGILMPRRQLFPLSAFVGVSSYEGRSEGHISVNAPWMTLRVAGRRLPFIVDRQAERIDAHAIASLAKRRPQRVEPKPDAG